MQSKVLSDYTSVMSYDILFLFKSPFAGSRSMEAWRHGVSDVVSRAVDKD